MNYRDMTHISNAERDAAVRSERKRSGASQVEIARRFGITQQSVSRILSGKSKGQDRRLAPKSYEELVTRTVLAPNGCLHFQGTRNEKGYGRIFARGKNRFAHRVAYELYHERQIPEGMLVCHTCDNPCCVNAAHLYLGTNSDNMADMVSRGRSLSRKGEDNPASKLTNAQAVAICDLYDFGGESHRSIGERFGVSSATVHRIVSGECYANATGRLPHRLGAEGEGQ